MTHAMSDLMRRATDMTRSGDLHGAQALIQQALAGTSFPGMPGATSNDDTADVIDVAVREVDEVDEAVAPIARPPADSPRGTAGQFIKGSHAAAGLRCDYRLSIPAGAPRGAPLVVMLHGCTQSAEDFAAGTRMNDVAGEKGCYVLYPAQSQQMNPQRCWNWFKHSHQSRGRGEPALLESLTRAIVAEHGIDASRVYVAGLSAGGAMAAVLAEAYPDTFAAVGVHSGLPVGAARDLPSALQAMGSGPAAGAKTARSAVPCIVFHGDADSTVNRSNGDAIAQAIPRASSDASRVAAGGGGRSATRTVFTDAQGAVTGEQWLVHGAPHAWAGGSSGGSYTDPRGPDASAEMLRFFLSQRRAGGAN